MLTMEQLEAMKLTNVETVDKELLTDMQAVQIDPSLPKEERILQYVEQIKNPYCFRCGQVVVTVKFDENSPSLQERLIHYFSSAI